MDVTALILALVTLAAGVLAGASWMRGRSAGALAQRDQAKADADVMRVERDAMSTQLRTAEAAAAASAERLDAERTAAAERLQAERAAAAEKAALLDQAEARLKDAFASLSQDALRKSNAQFLDLADAKFKEAGAPLTETLGKVELQLRQIEKERAGAQQALEQQIEFVRRTGEDLKQETAALVSALRKPQTRGRWGELQLRKCVEVAGMLDNCDFSEQATVSTVDGTQRPDMVIRLVGGKSIVVDSKVTLAAYLEAHDAKDDDVREARLTAHAKHLRTHVDQLAAKAYWSQLTPAPEFVVLFVPGEAFLAPALDRDPNLLEYAFGKRVHIATPTTLISVLRTCAYAWQQEALAQNAREVFDLGRELYQRISKLGLKVDTLGKRLGSAVGAYNETVASLESRVLPQARKLKDLKVVDDDLNVPRPVEEGVRPIAAAELVAAADEDGPVVALPIGTDAIGPGRGVDITIDLDRADDYGLFPDRPRDTNRDVG